MILLDTNIISAVMAPKPPESVLNWLDRQDTVLLFISTITITITIAEIGYGLRVFPDGKRRKLLEDRFEKFIAKGFEQRILEFDESSARYYAEVMGHRKEIGRPLGILDGQIAAIARAHKQAIATRNIRDFEECDLELINPFEQIE